MVEEYPQVAKGGRVSTGSQWEEYPQVAKGEGYPQRAKANIAIDIYLFGIYRFVRMYVFI